MLFTNKLLREIIVKYENQNFLEAAGIVRAAESVALDMFLNEDETEDANIIRWALIRLHKDAKFPYEEEIVLPTKKEKPLEMGTTYVFVPREN